MDNLTQNDFLIRVQLLNCCIGSKTDDLLSKIKIGACNVNELLIELQVLQGMMKSVVSYQVLVGDITEDDNCLTESEVQSIFDYMSNSCEQCFQFTNFNYV